MNQTTSSVTASPVPDKQRLNFWPKYFGKIPQWMLREPRTFAWMEIACAKPTTADTGIITRSATTVCLNRT